MSKPTDSLVANAAADRDGDGGGSTEVSPSTARTKVSCKEAVISIVCLELLPLVAGSAIALVGFHLWSNRGQASGLILLLLGLALVVRNGILVTGLRLCGVSKPVHVALCCFKLDPDRYWRHPAGIDVPMMQCMSPTG